MQGHGVLSSRCEGVPLPPTHRPPGRGRTSASVAPHEHQDPPVPRARRHGHRGLRPDPPDAPGAGARRGPDRTHVRPAQDVELLLREPSGRRVKRRYTIRRARPDTARSTSTSCCTARSRLALGRARPPGRRGRVPGPAGQARTPPGPVAPAGRRRVGPAGHRRDLRGAAASERHGRRRGQDGADELPFAGGGPGGCTAARPSRATPSCCPPSRTPWTGARLPRTRARTCWARPARWWRCGRCSSRRRAARRDLRQGLLELAAAPTGIAGRARRADA